MGFLSDQEQDRMQNEEDLLSDVEPAVKNSHNIAGEVSNEALKHKCTFEGCSKAFRRPSRLVWHIRQHTGEKPYKCDSPGCDKAYTTSSHLKRHQATHNLIQQALICEVCKLTLKSRFNLQKHFQRVHSNSSRLFCKECNSWFRKKNKFEEHMAIHQGIKFKCEKCSKEFGNLLKLNKHITYYHEKVYKCEEAGCSEVFSNFFSFRTHRKCHTKVTQFQCKTCGKVFKKKSNLMGHEKVHQGQLLACPYEGCSKTYSLPQNLNCHIRIKHQGIKFYCDTCQNGFSLKSSLIKHLRTHLDPPKPKTVKTGADRAKRKDAGSVKKSMLSQLVGVVLPPRLESALIHRDDDDDDD